MLLTSTNFSATPGRVGRKKINDETFTARFPEGTMARLRAALKPKVHGKPIEKIADVVRRAVDRELALQERRKGKR